MRGVSGAINGVEIVNSRICEGVSRAINGVEIVNSRICEGGFWRVLLFHLK